MELVTGRGVKFRVGRTGHEHTFLQPVMLVVEMRDCRVQTYLSADEAARLGSALLAVGMTDATPEEAEAA